MSEVVSHLGLCSSFNIALSSDLTNKNLTSSDFHYEEFCPDPSNLPKQSELIPRNISSSNAGLYILIHLTFNNRENYEAGNDHMWLLMHDSYELPTAYSTKFLMKPHQMYDIKINPLFYSIDDSLLSYSPEE